MTSRHLLFVVVLGFSALMACRSGPLPTGDGGGGAGGSGGAAGSGGSAGGGGSGGSGGSGGAGGVGGSGGGDIAHSCDAVCNRCASGPCCGTTCCNGGEWCDPATLTCRCGDHAGCSGGDFCATGGPIQPGGGGCGIICCGAKSPCPV